LQNKYTMTDLYCHAIINLDLEYVKKRVIDGTQVKSTYGKFSI